MRTPLLLVFTVLLTACNGATAPAGTVPVTSTPSAAHTSEGSVATDGTYLVGRDIQPGTYRTAGPADPSNECNWQRLSGLGGEGSDVIAFYFSAGPQVVEIKPSDKAFTTKNCQPWSRTQ